MAEGLKLKSAPILGAGVGCCRGMVDKKSVLFESSGEVKLKGSMEMESNDWLN